MAGNDFFRGEPENGPRECPPDPGLDSVFELLANWRRRCLLHLLRDRDTPRFWLTNLTLKLSELEGRVQATDTQEPHKLELELHHNHLPQLADAGVVEYDRERKTGRYLGDPALESLLEWEHAYTDTNT